MIYFPSKKGITMSFFSPQDVSSRSMKTSTAIKFHFWRVLPPFSTNGFIEMICCSLQSSILRSLTCQLLPKTTGLNFSFACLMSGTSFVWLGCTRAVKNGLFRWRLEVCHVFVQGLFEFCLATKRPFEGFDVFKLLKQIH